MWMWAGFSFFCLTAVFWLAAFALAEHRRMHSGYQTLTRYAAYIQFMQDKTELNRYGIAQQLKRGFGPLVAFSIPFNSMALIGGGALLFAYVGFSGSGGLIVWIWPILGICALAVHAVQAELMSSFPTAKGGSYAATLLSGKSAGRMSALLQLGGQWALVAYLNFEGSRWLGQAWAGWQGGSPTAAAVTFFIIFLLLQTLACLGGNKWYAGVQAGTAIIQLAACAVMLVVLAAALWPDFAYSSLAKGSADTAARVPVEGGWLIGLLLLWRLFVAGGSTESTAEETIEPRMRLPWGQFQAAAYVFTAGYLLLALTAMYGLAHPFSGSSAFLIESLSVVVRSSPAFAAVITLLIALSLFTAAMSILFASTRLLGALARESSLPALEKLGRVQSKRRSFTGAACLAGLMPAVVVGGLLLMPASWGSTASLLLVLGLLLHHGGLLIPMTGLLRISRRAQPLEMDPLWSLGRARQLICWIAVVSLLIVSGFAVFYSPYGAITALGWGGASYALIYWRRFAAEEQKKRMTNRQELLQLERSHPQ
ncbi:Amino acid transporter [Paenibacillaceae bacterium GAS479]|nr:Amino acid transporter [Paenibacillaceae bacterium GAS479]